MDFASYLAQTVTPLRETKPDPEVERIRREQKEALKKANRPAGLIGNALLHYNKIREYRSAWKEGEDWLKLPEIEKRLGRQPQCCSPTLRKWVKMGIMEIRHELGKNGKPKRRYGTEFRWKRKVTYD